MIGLIIILVFPFIYFYTQMNRFNEKTGNIRKAIEEGKETYYDYTTGKTHWTANGAVVKRISLPYSNWKPGYQDTYYKDDVILGLNDGKIYRNFSKEEFAKHVQKQIDEGKCWCGERQEYRDYGCWRDERTKYHMKDKYFYRLKIKTKSEFVCNNKARTNITTKYTVFCYKNIYNPKTKTFGDDIPITYKEYRELGGFNDRCNNYVDAHTKENNNG